MKLEDLIATEDELLNATMEKLANNVLLCLSKGNKSVPIRRRGLAGRLVMGYPQEFGKRCLYAIEESIMYLEHQMLIGIDPDEREFVFLTRKGQQQAIAAEKELLVSA